MGTGDCVKDHSEFNLIVRVLRLLDVDFDEKVEYLSAGYGGSCSCDCLRDPYEIAPCDCCDGTCSHKRQYRKHSLSFVSPKDGKMIKVYERIKTSSMIADVWIDS